MLTRFSRRIIKFTPAFSIVNNFYASNLKQIYNAAIKLNQLDSITIDKMCEIFHLQYHQQNKNQIIRKFNFITAQKHKQQNSQLLYQHIESIYKWLDQAEIGFLKGDLHSETFYKLAKFLENKTPKQLSQNLPDGELNQFFNKVTDSRMLRIPKQGIKLSAYQNKKNLYQRQLILQKVSGEQALQRFTTVLESLKNLQKVHLLQIVRKHIIEWFPAVCKAIRDEQQKCKQQQLLSSRKQYAQYLIKINPQKLASIALSETMREILAVAFEQHQDKVFEMHEFMEIHYKTFCKSIARLINAQLVYDRQEQKFKQAQKTYDAIKNAKNEDNKTNSEPGAQQIEEQEKKTQSLYEKFQSLNLQYRYIKPQLRKSYLQDLADRLVRHPRQQIPEDIRIKIGSLLIYIIKEVVKVKNKYGYFVPLLVQQYKYLKKSGQFFRLQVLKIDEHFLDKLMPAIQKQENLTLHLDRALPMIIQPLPWIQYQIGGYYLNSTLLMRFSQQCSLQQRAVKFADNSQIYNILNYLGSIPWRINKKVLNIVEKVWEQGGQVGQIPKRYSQNMANYVSQLKQSKDSKVNAQILKKIQLLRDQHSLRSDFLLKMGIARVFQKVDKCYYPHNLDFRGRTYPVSPHLSHIGNDFSRGLLQFGEGKRIGKSGLKWLKIHCANLMGKDKAIIEEKLIFIQQNLGLIRAIAQNPLKHRQWLQLQSCWQALSAIIQLNEALKLPNPQDYVSHVHIHQDGSCNGLQHYAALGRDIEGAYQVNLGVTQRPGDVYTHVAKMVIQSIEIDKNNPQSPNHQIANKLTDQIKRKTIKQTVMTSVYGVTFIGARQQIYKQLKNQDFMNQRDTYAASLYVATLTLRAISNLFQGAHNIKKWLKQCAKLIVQTGNPVSWITPLGLPIVQPYRSISKTDVISSVTQSITTPVDSQSLPVNKTKQQSAFPPNFVHSLDATHMMFTARQCQKKNICFAAVHDSYWTHAADVDQMNDILRQQFVNLHSQPLLEKLRSSFKMRYPEIDFPEIPQRGEFNLEIVKKSIYFFS